MLIIFRSYTHFPPVLMFMAAANENFVKKCRYFFTEAFIGGGSISNRALANRIAFFILAN